MLLKRLSVGRRFKAWGLLDIWKKYDEMKRRGKIRYQPKFDIRLVPKGFNESCTVCWTCKKVIFDDTHYKNHHSKLPREEQKALLNIGRTLVNRLTSPGLIQHFTGVKSKKRKLLQNIESLYGSRFAKRLSNPCRRIQQSMNNTSRANSYLNNLRKTNPLARNVSISLEKLEISRADIDPDRNMFCVHCGCWFSGRWVHHRIRKHKGFSKFENEVLRLYSVRLKSVMVSNVLLMKPSLIKERNFFKLLQSLHYVFDDQSQNLRTTAFIEKIRGVCQIFTRKLVVDDHTIRWKDYITAYKKPLDVFLTIRAYTKFRRLFGRKNLKGFVNFWKFRLAQLNNRRLMAKLARGNPSGFDSINFLYVARPSLTTPYSTTGHVVLSHYQALHQTATIYEGCPVTIDKPLTENIKKHLRAHHQNVVGSVRAGYCPAYSLQWDRWSCAFRALYACLGLMNHKNPSDFTIKRKQMFRFTKMAVEDEGRELEEWKLDDIWKNIAKEKKAKSKELVNFEIIKSD